MVTVKLRAFIECLRFQVQSLGARIMLSSKMKRVAIGSLTAVICGAGQGVFAHTTVKDSSVDEGSRLFTALQIPHGCETGAGEHLPVIAQSCCVSQR